MFRDFIILSFLVKHINFVFVIYGKAIILTNIVAWV
jgi:hypothetical protein